SLFLGSNRLWDEEADGVIIATPTGSTGYAESSGGVSLYNDPEVLEIVPLSPVDKRARPIVVKDSEVVSVKNILSPGHQVVIDGITRVRTHSKEVIVRKSRHPALFVKLRPRVAGDSSTKQGLPPSARLVVKVLESQGNLTHKDLEKETGLPGRTLRDTLGKLISKDVIGKKVFVSDPRQNTYFLRRKK
ncbi:MAG TPA: hypothetical protein VJI67_01050, partial [archaeon]|nr:hypothetical protein [archaeon]